MQNYRNKKDIKIKVCVVTHSIKYDEPMCGLFYEKMLLVSFLFRQQYFTQTITVFIQFHLYEQKILNFGIDVGTLHLQS